MMAAGVDGPTEAGQGIRERLLAIALRRFAHDGYGRTRLRDVAAEAGLTTGPMYHHFGSKRALYREVGLRALERMMDVYEQVGRSGTELSRLERTQAFLERLATHEREDYLWLGVQMELDAHRHPAVAELREEWAHQTEDVWRVALGTRPHADDNGWEQDLLSLLTMTLVYGQSRALVRNGLEAMGPSVRGIQRLLAEPPRAPE